MLQTQIQENLSMIQSFLQNQINPKKTLSLFYTTIRFIEKEQAANSKSNFLASLCHPYLNAAFGLNQSANKYTFRVQDLFNEFLDKNKKANSELDKVNAHMLKITTQMIVKLNEQKVNNLYRNHFFSGQSSAENFLQNNQKLNNRLHRGRSLSHNNRIQQILLSTFTGLNESPKSGHNNEIELQALKSRISILRKDNSNNNSQISQNTVQSTSSRQIKSKKQSKLIVNVQSSSTKSQKTLFYTIKQQLQTVLNLYSQHKIDQAYQLLTKLQQTYPYNEHYKNIIASYTQQEKDKLEQLKIQYEQMKFYYKYFDLTGYKLDKKEDGITMHYKTMEKQNLVAIQVQSEVNVSMERFLAIASEIQLYDKYVPFNYETKCLRENARNKKIGRSKIFIPLLNNRQAYFQAKAYDRLRKENCIFIFSKNLKKQDLAKLGLQYKTQGLIDLDYIFFLLSYTPTTKQSGIIKMATCIDMKINILPKFIMNKTARMFAFDYFKNMINIGKKFEGSVWDKAMKNNIQHYNFFKQKINEYYTFKQGNKNASETGNSKKNLEIQSSMGR